MGTTAWMFWGMIFGAIGSGFFIYGWRQKAAVPLLCGVALMVFPWFVTSTLLLLIVGAALMAIPYFIRI